MSVPRGEKREGRSAWSFAPADWESGVDSGRSFLAPSQAVPAPALLDDFDVSRDDHGLDVVSREVVLQPLLQVDPVPAEEFDVSDVAQDADVDHEFFWGREASPAAEEVDGFDQGDLESVVVVVVFVVRSVQIAEPRILILRVGGFVSTAVQTRFEREAEVGVPFRKHLVRRSHVPPRLGFAPERGAEDSAMFPKLVLEDVDPLLVIDVQPSLVAIEGERCDGQLGRDTLGRLGALGADEGSGGGGDGLRERVGFADDGADLLRVVGQERTRLLRAVRLDDELLDCVSEHWWSSRVSTDDMGMAVRV